MAGFWMTTSSTTCAVALILSFSSVICLPGARVTALSFNYSTFVHASDDIKVEGDASISTDGRIDVTKNSVLGGNGNLNSISSSRGRESYSAQPMLLWDRDTGEVASFITRFSSFIYAPTDAQFGGINNKGTGMAFFLAGYPSSLPAGSEAYNMGLTNHRADAVATGDGWFVAVEFDTFNDTIAQDPSTTYDHIGIDINSIRSVNTTVLPSFSLNNVSMIAEIRYNNISSILEMTLWMEDGKNRNYTISHKVDLKSALPEQVSVGFSGSTSTSVELHRVSSWNFSSSLEPKSAPEPGHGGVIAGATVGAVLFLVLLFSMAALFVRRRRIKKRKELEMEEDVEEIEVEGLDNDGTEKIMEIEMGVGPRRIPYHELIAATRGFSSEEKLGQGGFGSVYRGYLGENGGLAMAIKRFAKGSSMQGRKEYKSEIKVISRFRHRNLVQLVGWCHGRDELLLVYELMPNRSLDIHLDGDGTFLTWPMWVNIVLGLGSALLYIHEEWEKCVVHRDVKPSNVMLDESFNAKLGDFGFARFIDHAVGMQTMTALSGTPGYMDPECVITGKASAESDVYSFGVVVLEVACGRKPMSLLDGEKEAVFRLVEWAWDLYGQGEAVEAVDERLKGEYDAADQVERVVAVGLWCAHPDPRARPSIRAAMAALQSSAPAPVLPAKMPVATYGALVASPAGLFSSGVTSSSLTQSTTTATTQTSSASDSSSSTGWKDSSSLLKHQY